MKDMEHLQLIRKYEQVGKMETLIDNIDIDFEDRNKSYSNDNSFFLSGKGSFNDKEQK